MFPERSELFLGHRLGVHGPLPPARRHQPQLHQHVRVQPRARGLRRRLRARLAQLRHAWWAPPRHRVARPAQGHRQVMPSPVEYSTVHRMIGGRRYSPVQSNTVQYSTSDDQRTML
eukprot:4360324-Pyramimonas_sp.AAC.1